MSSTALNENPKRPSSSTRFDAPGLNFKAKLIGSEDVAKSRGHKMCQVAMAKVKAAVLAIGEHKTRITVNVSIEGIKIMDEKAEVVLRHHPVHKVSFISRDTNDPRAFGYVFNGENGGHQFIGIKTEKAAEPLVMTLRDLFLTMVELKQERERAAEKNKANVKTSENEIKEENKKNQTDETQDDEKTHPSTMDLLGFDSGPEQINDIQQLDPLVSGTSGTFSAWPGNNQSPHSTLSGSMVSGSSLQVPGIPMASTVYHQHQTYHQSIPRMQHSAFGVHHSTAFPAQTWPRTPAQVPAPAMVRAEAQPPKSIWMPLDPSTPASGLLQPTSANPLVANDPLPPSTPTKKYPDPFADLALIPPQGQHRPGRKASREDFVKETPKQSLLDISRQQQQQQQQPPAGTNGSTRLHDPSSAAGVSPPRTLYNPLADGQTPLSAITYPASPHPPPPPPLHVLDNNSSAASFQGPDGKVGRDPTTPGSSTSRPRPRGSAASRPGSLAPLPVKVKPKALCTCALEELHAKRYSRNTIIDTKLFNNCTSNCTNCTNRSLTRPTIIQVNPGNGDDGKWNGKSLETEEGGECSNDCEGKSFEDLWSELSRDNADRLICRLRRDNAWQSPKYSGDGESIDAENMHEHENSMEMFGTTDHLGNRGSDDSQETGLVIRNSNFSETSDEYSRSGSLSSDWIPEESAFPCDVFFGDSFFYADDGEDLSADNTDFDSSVTGTDAVEGGDTLSDSCLKPAPDSRLGSNRRGSARRTRSLSGLVTIREETDSNPDSQALRQRSRVEATDAATRDTVAWIPDDAQRCHGNFPFSAVDPWAHPGGSPFLDVDPFFDEFASAFLADPFEGHQVEGQIVHGEVIDLFDVYAETPETFNTRAVTFDF